MTSGIEALFAKARQSLAAAQVLVKGRNGLLLGCSVYKRRRDLSAEPSLKLLLAL
jgi:hypothetical protein